MIRSSLAKKIRFDEKLQWLEDHIYIYQCFMHAEKFVAIPDVIYNYMIRDVFSLSSVRDPHLIMHASRKELFVKQSLLNGCDIDTIRYNWQVFHGRELLAISNLYTGIFNKEYRKTFLNKYVRIDEDNPLLIVKLANLWRCARLCFIAL